MTGAKRRPLSGCTPVAWDATAAAPPSTAAIMATRTAAPTRLCIISIMTEPTLTPSRLWKQMTAEQRLDAARAFWNDEEAANDQIQAVLLIAQQKKFRPKFVLGLDLERKSRHLATLLSLPDVMVARTLVVYHLAEQREMMGAFLDALGI